MIWTKGTSRHTEAYQVQNLVSNFAPDWQQICTGFGITCDTSYGKRSSAGVFGQPLHWEFHYGPATPSSLLCNSLWVPEPCVPGPLGIEVVKLGRAGLTKGFPRRGRAAEWPAPFVGGWLSQG